MVHHGSSEYSTLIPTRPGGNLSALRWRGKGTGRYVGPLHRRPAGDQTSGIYLTRSCNENRVLILPTLPGRSGSLSSPFVLEKPYFIHMEPKMLRNPTPIVNAGTRLLVCLACLAAGTVTAAETTTTTTTTTNADGTTTTVQETTTNSDPATAQQPAAEPQVQTPRLVGPTGATGVIRRSDRRQDRRAGHPRID